MKTTLTIIISILAIVALSLIPNDGKAQSKIDTEKRPMACHYYREHGKLYPCDTVWIRFIYKNPPGKYFFVTKTGVNFDGNIDYFIKTKQIFPTEIN